MRSSNEAAFDALVERAAKRYRPSGRYAWHFARGKLRHDPLFRWLACERLPIARGRVLDLGCGQGVLFAWLLAADPALEADEGVELRGVELRADRARTAQRALGGRASIERGDIRDTRFPDASLIVIADVLLYLGAHEQSDVLARAAAALAPGGTLLLREGDPGAGVRFAVTRWSEQLACALRGAPRQKLQYRRPEEWRAALEALGLIVTVQPMSAGTPFANVLYEARKAGV